MAYEHLFPQYRFDHGKCMALYNHENKRLHRRKKTMSQYQFKRLVAEAWMAQNAGGTQRKRKSRSITPVAPRGRRRRSSTVPPVPLTTRYDGMNHMPAATCGRYNRQRCALCNALTTTYCTKCHVHLCCIYKRNCFRPFHYEVLQAADSDSDAEGIDEPDAVPLDAAAINDPDSPPPLDADV